MFQAAAKATWRRKPVDETAYSVRLKIIYNKKHSFGYSTFGTWLNKSNGRSKRKTSKVNKTVVKARTTKSSEDQWEAAFNDYIQKRDAANEARKTLVKLVEQIR